MSEDLNVANYIINACGRQHTNLLELQGMLYHIKKEALNKNVPFNIQFEAWKIGPMNRNVYNNFSYFEGYNITECEPAKIDNISLKDIIDKTVKNRFNIDYTRSSLDDVWKKTYNKGYGKDELIKDNDLAKTKKATLGLDF